MVCNCLLRLCSGGLGSGLDTSASLSVQLIGLFGAVPWFDLRIIVLLLTIYSIDLVLPKEIWADNRAT